MTATNVNYLWKSLKDRRSCTRCVKVLITESGRGFLLCDGGGGGGNDGLLRERGWLDAIAPGGTT